MAVYLVGGFLALALAALARGYLLVNVRKTAAGADIPVAVRRHIAIWRWSGIAVGALAAVAAAVSGTLSTGLMVAARRPSWWTAAAWALLALVPVWAALLGWSGLAVLAPPRKDFASASL